MEFTVTNTSKEMSSFSDYPPSPDFPTYLPHKMMLKYLTDYAEHFGVTERIRFNHAVHKIEKLPNARWKVVVKDLDRSAGSFREEEFDAIMVCIGHHSIPKMPEFRDRNLFKGRIIHAKHYKNSDGYRGKAVLVVGFGNSAADVACSLVGLADQVHASIRRGTWMLPSHISGIPVDFCFFRRFAQALPKRIGDFLFHKQLQDAFNHDLVGFTPEHSPASQQGTVNDLLPRALLAKQILLQPPINRFTENGVIFQGSEYEVNIDEVVVATGYRPDIPFIESRIYGKQNEAGDVERLLLYKGMYSLTEDTIAFLGMVEAAGNLGQMFEMQARHAMAVFNKEIDLVSSKVIRRRAVMQDIESIKSKFISDSDRHSAMVNKMEYMDMLAEDIKAKPDWCTMMWTDPYLFYRCIFGPLLPYQYRLVGPYSWPGARNAILSAPENQFKGLRPIRPLPKTIASPSLSPQTILLIIFLLGLTILVRIF
ncbi:dimethylaniline monooxygenase [N-oxide-forming] 2 [Galendromus occidentalis]|uniref:Flavin-containing monooxygenase n=1 Tax=Galendromus occidentalis TaxID=34638 RepID=A0AAJ6QV34_9ACAR|nr:dimethylaniline monooxygenase [N-oxide-forming] 2 [Galendromus occidentalis]